MTATAQGATMLCDYAACRAPATVNVDAWAYCPEHSGRARTDAAPTPRPRPTPVRTTPTRPAACEHVTDLAVAQLLEHPGNIRRDLGDLTDLAASIRAQGILQPLLVSPLTHSDGTVGRWVVIGGHRRLAAARQAGLTRVPVAVRRLEDGQTVEAMLVENLQRADLHPLDEARAYQLLLDQGYDQGSISRQVGVPQGRVSQRLALLNLTPAEQDALRRGELSVHEAYLAGRQRGGRRLPDGQKRPKPRRVPHFTVTHRLAEDAGARCEHETTLKLGIACGPCWEQAIRDDERRRLAKAGAA